MRYDREQGTFNLNVDTCWLIFFILCSLFNFFFSLLFRRQRYFPEVASLFNVAVILLSMELFPNC